MPKTKPRKQKTSIALLFRLKEGLLVLGSAAALFLLLSLITYHTNDPGWSYASARPAQNAAGAIGAYCADFLFSFFGLFSYLIPFLLMLALWSLYRHPAKENEKRPPLILMRIIGMVLTLSAGSSLATLLLPNFTRLMPQGSGGIIGQTLLTPLFEGLNFYGSLLILMTALGLGLTLLTEISWIKLSRTLLVTLRSCLLFVLQKSHALFQSSISALKNAFKTYRENKHCREGDIIDIPSMEPPPPPPVVPEQTHTKNIFSKKKPQDIEIVNLAKTNHNQIELEKNTKKTSHHLKIPSIDLLDDPAHTKSTVSKEMLQQTARLVEEKLTDFSISAKVVGICPGPIVTRYELQLAPGLKVSKLSGLAKDLARALSATSVRIVDVIPGKSVVGLEIPNKTRDIVYLKEVLKTKSFMKSRSPLVVALGKDVAGTEELTDLSKMPHMLVAGTTGSGKSVGVNAMVISMLLKATPDDLRIIMIDPKMLELSVYEGIPHLLTPVVTDMKEAANALRWCVKEMDRRYKLMASIGVRNILGLNEKIKAAARSGKPIKDPLFEASTDDQDQIPNLTTLPYVVVVIDEFADMMMVVGKKVEELIARIAQKARAAGIHLILATQRPSVDVITGLIKANIPSRISFQVSSKIDSRTILDQMGAEQLLGHGDMLFLPPGTSIPNRIHGAFVSDNEVHAVVNAWKAQAEPDYIASILEEDNSDNSLDDADKDVLFDEAVQVVIDTKRASISGIQRRLKIGYNRAARLVEQMEEAGIVGQMQSNGMRDILVNTSGGSNG